MILYFYDWDYKGGNADFEQAIALNPNLPIAHHLYGKNLVVEARFDEALAQLDRALELDPYSAAISKDIGETLFYANRIDEALAAFERSGELDPGSLAVYYWLMRCYELLGQQDLAVDYHLALNRGGCWDTAGVPEAARIDPDRLERVYRELGWDAYWREWIAMLARVAEHRHIEPFRFVEAHMRVGDLGGALDWIETAFAQRSAWIPSIHVDPLLHPLHGDARFADLMQRAGLDGYDVGKRPGAR